MHVSLNSHQSNHDDLSCISFGVWFLQAHFGAVHLSALGSYDMESFVKHWWMVFTLGWDPRLVRGWYIVLDTGIFYSITVSCHRNRSSEFRYLSHMLQFCRNIPFQWSLWAHRVGASGAAFGGPEHPLIHADDKLTMLHWIGMLTNCKG